MRFKIKILWTTLLTTQLWPLIVLAIEVHEPQSENSTEIDDLTLFPTTETVTLPPTDNGMVLGEAPEGATTDSLHGTVGSLLPETGNIHPAYEETEEDLPKPTVSPSILFDYPSNHKNFSPSAYLGAIETPPVLSNYNKYQQQYKEYYEQKNQYNQKPIKFEQNAAKNRYVPQGLSSFFEDDSHVKKQLEQVQANNKLKGFPYAYEHKLTHNAQEPAVTATGSGNVNSYAPHDYRYSEGNDHNEVDAHSHEELSTDFDPPLPGGYEHHGDFNVGFGHEHHVQHNHHKGGHSWKKVLRMLTALVPLGLFIATLTPNVLQINTTVDQKPSRQRSIDDLGIRLTEEDLNDPLVQLVQQYGLESLDDPQCEDKIFCEMSRMGQNQAGNFIQKGFWYLANETPDDLAQQVGMKELFKAIRTGACDMYKCEPKTKVEDKADTKPKTESKPTKRKKVISVKKP